MTSEDFRKLLEHRIKCKEDTIRVLKKNKVGSKCQLNALQTVIEELQYLLNVLNAAG
jgi:hypothetical protein